MLSMISSPILGFLKVLSIIFPMLWFYDFYRKERQGRQEF